jgi:hypothetical protein
VRIPSPVTGDGPSSADADCIKRGSGWHPFRDLLASSSDHNSSSPPFESPTASKFLPFSVPALFLFYCSSFCLPSCPNQCMSRLVSTLLYEFWCHIPSRTRVFLDPLWLLLTIFPINRLVLYSIFFSSLPSNPPLLLSHASSVLVLITAALSTFLFTAASVHLSVWATMRKTWESSSRGMPSSTIFPLSLFLHSCITILN